MTCELRVQLQLDYNQLTTINACSFDDALGVEEIWLTGNPIHCDCAVAWTSPPATNQSASSVCILLWSLSMKLLRDRRTDIQTDGRLTLAIVHRAVNSWARTRGAQLTAGYTVNTYSKPPLYYTLGAVAPLLPCLTLGPGGPLLHVDRQTYQPDNRTAAVLPVPSCKLGRVSRS